MKKSVIAWPTGLFHTSLLLVTISNSLVLPVLGGVDDLSSLHDVKIITTSKKAVVNDIFFIAFGSSLWFRY